MRLLYLLAFILLLAPATAYGDVTPSPQPSAAPTGADALKILACSLEFNQISGVPAKLHVDFENLNSLPVTHIRFRIRAGVSTFAVMDIGKFDPNVRIHHDLDPPLTHMRVISAITGGGIDGLDCSIDAFTLSDGYTWVSPQLQQELQQRQQQHR
jgi:hypothetical protein